MIAGVQSIAQQSEHPLLAYGRGLSVLKCTPSAIKWRLHDENASLSEGHVAFEPVWLKEVRSRALLRRVSIIAAKEKSAHFTPQFGKVIALQVPAFRFLAFVRKNRYGMSSTCRFSPRESWRKFFCDVAIKCQSQGEEAGVAEEIVLSRNA